MTATPGSVSAFPTQTTPSITVNLAFVFSTAPPTSGTITPSGLPAGVTTIPSPITYSIPVGSTSASTSFAFSVGAAATPGTYLVTLTDNNGAGSTTVMLAVSAPSFTATATPNPVTLIMGGASQPVTVSTSATPGFFASSISYSFSGFPTFIVNNGPMTSAQGTTGYSPVTFNFSLGAGAVAGTYSGTLTGTPAGGTPKSFPFAVVVQQPDIGATFTQPVVSMCNGQTANDSVQLSPLNGYSGTPTLTFSAVPAGTTIAPLTAAAMPPGQTIPFSIAANGASSGIAVLNVRDAAAGINKNVQLQINIGVADFTPAVTPASIAVTAGGSAQSVAASITPTACWSSNVTVSASGQPPGMTIAANPPAIAAPGFAPISISIQASGATAPGTYPVTFTFAAGAITRSVTVQIGVNAAPDYALALIPPSLTIQQGVSGTTAVSLRAFNGFAGRVSVTAPSMAGVTFTPSAFSLSGTASQTVNAAVASSVAPGVYPLVFSSTSSGVIGPRTATLQLTVAAPPGFVLTLTPDSVTIPAGGTASVTAAVVASNGFNGTVSVTAPTLPGITFTPSSFALTPNATQSIAIAVDPSAAPGPRGPQLFQATSPGITNGQGATLALTVGARPDFTVAVAPPSVSIRSGGSVPVTVSAIAANGFAGAIGVAAPAIPGLTFQPATFTLAANTSQQVTITASAAAAGRGPLRAIFNASAPGAPSHAATLLVTVLPPLPLLTAATPPALVAGAQSTVVRVAGDFLQPGAQFHSSDPSLVIESSTILSQQLADVRMTVRANASPGPRSLTVTNPDGGTSATPLVILVYPSSSIAAPLDVLAAAIVFPAQGAFVATNDAVYPRGLLATAGTGSIIGSWQLDGVPFDRFVVNAAGGMPVEVRTNVPIPVSFLGTHTLTIVVETPRKFVSPGIDVVDTSDRVSRLTLLAPLEGAILRGSPQLFRWSLVPNCSGYDVEVAPPAPDTLPDAVTPIARFHVADAEWKPSAADLTAIGPGIHRWRVRPRCAGETALEPSAWQRFAILPQHVDIALLPATTNARGAKVVHWSGGIAGLLYRVDFVSPSGETIFSALTPATDYAIPRTLPPGTAVRVSAIAPDGTVLGTSAVSSPLSRAGTRETITLAQQTLIEFTTAEPADGATITNPQPHIAAQWKGSAPADQVMLLVDNTDLTQVAKVTPTSVAYDSLIALSPGPHAVALAVAGNVKRWSFSISGGAGATPAAAAPVQPPRGDWVLAPVGTITLVRAGAGNNNVQAQLSALTDLNDKSLSNKSTGDLSLSHNLKTNQTVQQSRNWITEFGAHQGAAVPAESARVGFAPPDFFDQAQLLSAGLPRGGVEAKFAVPIGSLAVYQTFTSKPAGLVTGLFGPDLKIKGGSFALPTSPAWDFRLSGIHVDEVPSLNAAGGSGRALSIFGRYTHGTAVNAILEAARGDFKPNAGSDDAPRKGNAFRLALSGMHGTLNYALNLRRTQGGFVNPANRAFTPSGVPDRTGGDLTIGKLFGLTSVSVQLRHLQDGTSSNLLVPRTRESGGMASLMRTFGSHLSLSLAGNLTRDKGEGAPSLDLPGSDRNQRGATGTLSELFGRFNFSQTFSSQSLRDHVNALNDQTTNVATVTGSGQFTPNLNLAGVLSATRNAGSAITGRTDQYLASLQPTILISRLYLTLQPRASYSTSSNDLLASRSTAEDYQALATFAPIWFGSMFSVQLSGDWARNRTAGQSVPSPFIHRYAASFSIHAREGAGPAYTQGALMPMAAPVAAPNPAASAPGTVK